MKTTRIIQLIFLLLCGCFLQVNAEERTVTFDATVDKVPYGTLTLTKGDVTIRLSSGRLGYYSENGTDNYYMLSSGGSIFISVPNGTIKTITFTSDKKNSNESGGMKNLTYRSSGLSESSSSSSGYTKSWNGTATSEQEFYSKTGVHFTRIEVVYIKNKELAGLSFGSETNFSVTIGDDFTEPTLINPHSLTVTYSSSNTSLATVNASSGEVTIGSTPGTVTITASSAETETYAAGSARYTVTIVKASEESYYFELVDDASSLRSGNTIVITNIENMKVLGAQDGDNKRMTAHNIVRKFNNIIEVDENASKITLGGGSSGWTFNDGNGFLSAYSSGNSLYDKEAPIDEEYSRATITIDESGNATIKFNIMYTSKYIRYSSDYNWFSCYVQNTQSPVQIYRQTTAPAETVSLTMLEVGYATLYYSDKNLIVPEGLQAKTYYVEDGRVLYESKTYQPGDIIPGGTGVILKGSAGNYELEVTSETGTTDSNNALRGSDTTATTTGGTVYYKLAVDPDNEAVGFYWGSENGAAFENQAHRAYLATSASAANSCFIFDDAVSAINTAPMSTADDHHIYNLNGQRIDATQQLPRGIYIKDGKKRLTR